MAPCLIDYSDYENAPGGLATFGGFLCDFGSDFLATLTATMPPTHPARFSLPCPAKKAQTSARYQIPAQIGAVCPPRVYAAAARHAARDGTKSRTWCSLPRPENDLCKPCVAPCNSGIMRRIFRDGDRKATQSENIDR